jgi:aspartate aminotransferase-like enzyme
MICFKAKRPFSLDKKIENLDSYIPKGRKACEIRLLSVKREHRNGVVFLGMLNTLADICIKDGFNMALISGTTRQQKLYSHLGFKPFYDTVGTEDARFVPMYLTLEEFNKTTKNLLTFERDNSRVNLMPGPVNISDEVRTEFAMIPISHRSFKFINDFQDLKKKLCKFVNAKHVEIITGSGTLSNDVVAAQLATLKTKGLILTNGEFGERLVSHAKRSKLNHIVFTKVWGEQFTESELRGILNNNKDIDWIWAVHCETSIGVMNEICFLSEICSEFNIKLCMDCISSIATIPVNLEKLYIATGVSGKAICAFPGLSLIFYNQDFLPNLDVPRYIDLGFYNSEQGIPFTINTNLVYALNKAIDSINQNDDFYESIKAKADRIRESLIEFGYDVINKKEISSPAVVTVELPSKIKSLELGEYLESNNCFISYRSGYLVKRNLFQVYITRNTTDEHVSRFLEIISLFNEMKE